MLPLCLQEITQTANTLILVQQDPFQASDLQNYAMTNVRCFKTLSP